MTRSTSPITPKKSLPIALIVDGELVMAVKRRARWWVVSTYVLTTVLVMPLLASIVSTTIIQVSGLTGLAALGLSLVFQTVGYIGGAYYSLAYLRESTITDDWRGCITPSIVAFLILLAILLVAKSIWAGSSNVEIGILAVFYCAIAAAFAKITSDGFLRLQAKAKLLETDSYMQELVQKSAPDAPRKTLMQVLFQKWGWKTPVFTWRYYPYLLAFWVIALVLPWQWLYRHLPFYSEYIAWLASIPLFSEIDLFPDAVRYGGLEYSKAQLAFVHTCGVLNVVYVLMNTGKMVYLKPAPIRASIQLGLTMAAVAAFELWVQWIARGNINPPIEDSIASSEVMLISWTIGYWYVIGMQMAFVYGCWQDIWGRFLSTLKKGDE